MFHRFITASLSMKGVVDRIGLFFKVGWQWLTSAPGYRGALLCGLSAIGAIIAIGYNGSKGIFGPSAPVSQTSDIVAARLSAMSNEVNARSMKNSLPKNGIVDAESVEPSSNNELRPGKEGLSPSAIASDRSFLVDDTENKNAAIRDKDKVKKSANKSPKKTQRRVSSERDRKFSPSRELKRAGEKITSVIRQIF